MRGLLGVIMFAMVRGLADAQCTVDEVERANMAQLQPILSELVDTPFFSLFRVDTSEHCPWHQEEHSCETVAPPEEREVFTGPALCSIDKGMDKGMESDMLDLGLSMREAEEQHALPLVADCDDVDLPTFWLDMCGAVDDSESSLDGKSDEFVSLSKNPERWTGYNGTAVWQAMYGQNCFTRDGMCYEERVLYRLLSGMHASINIHISRHYFPPRKGKRIHFEPNPQRYKAQFGDHPERLDNLHFAFVVLLRAVHRAGPYFAAQTHYGPRSQSLVRLLVDSAVLRSCQPAFTAFDESVLFADGAMSKALKQEFKGVFRNISSLFDCITCQQCKLHGKLQLLGIGTALKILLLPEDLISVSRREAVALFNTLGKFSQAIGFARELESLLAVPRPTPAPEPARTGSRTDHAFATLRKVSLPRDVEQQALTLALQNDEALLAFLWHYDGDHDMIKSVLARTAAPAVKDDVYDAVVIGAGLSGLVCALRVAERGGNVLLLEKEAFFGGNSAWASSGVNAMVPGVENDSVDLYRNDTLRSGGLTTSPLVDVLTEKSGAALAWLRAKDIPLPLRSRLGGHSADRTYRPETGMAGSEMVLALGRLAEGKKGPALPGRITVIKKAHVERLKLGAKRGCVFKQKDGTEKEIDARNIVIATGGFAAARGVGSLLAQHRPDLVDFATTNGRWATGDGIRMAADAGAGTVDMDHVQLHPTAFARKVSNVSLSTVVEEEPLGGQRTLAAEILRGLGGVLLDAAGRRFVNELDTRKNVVDKMMSAKGVDQGGRAFVLVVGNRAANETSHIALYTHKSLLTTFATLAEVAAWMGVDAAVVEETVRAADTTDEKRREMPSLADDAPFHVGLVTPALHYTMGGIKISPRAQVLNAEGAPVDGLWAIGEAAGGIHGHNRLGGNALTECVVYGLEAGNNIPLTEAAGVPPTGSRGISADEPSKHKTSESRGISVDELSQHKTSESCWVSLHGQVYDFTDFLDEHPAGPQAILDFAGQDGTVQFDAVHNMELLDDFDPIGHVLG